MVAGLARDVADDPEGEAHIHVEHVFARHEGADQGEGDDHRRQVDSAHHGDPRHVARQRQDGQDHEKVGHRHGREHAVADLRPFLEQAGAEVDAVILHHNQHDRRRRAARDADHQERHQGARGDAVVGRFRRDQALRVAGAVELRGLGVGPGLLVGDEGGDAGPGAGNDADHQSDEAGPDDVLPALEGVGDAFEGRGPAGRAHRLAAPLGQDRIPLDDDERLGDGEQPDQGRDQRDAVIELEETEGAARRRVDHVGADGADHQPEEAGDQALEGVARGDAGDQRDAEQHDHDHLDAVHVVADLGQHRHREQRDDRGQQAAERRGHERHGERLLAAPGLGHGIAVERRRRGAGGARDVDQDRRYAGAHARGAIERDHEHQADLDLHHQGQRQQDDDRVSGAEPRDRTDDQAQEDGRHDHPPERQGVQEQRAEQLEVSFHRRASLS